MRCSETSERKIHYTLRNIPKERRSSYSPTNTENVLLSEGYSHNSYECFDNLNKLRGIHTKGFGLANQLNTHCGVITREVDQRRPEAIQTRNKHAAICGPSSSYRVPHWLLYARWSAETRGGVLRARGLAQLPAQGNVL